MKKSVQLSPGLTCDNCVVQWEYNRENSYCIFANGTSVLTKLTDNTAKSYSAGSFLVGYGEVVCPRQQWLNCADIRITPDPTKPIQSYKPDPIPILLEIPQVYSCDGWDLKYRNLTDPNYVIQTPDPYKYTGAGIQCWNLNPNDIPRT